MSVSLSSFCALKGICSKNDAKKFIELGCVKLNDQLVKKDILVRSSLDPGRVTLSRRAQRVASSKLTVLLHKPQGYLSTFTRKTELWSKSLLVPENRCDADLKNGLNPSQLRRLLPLNPLDHRAAGLAIFSEDSSLIEQYRHCEEEYQVVFTDSLTAAKLFALRAEVNIDGIALPPLKVSQLRDNVARIAIKGSSSKIRKACLLAGLEIKSLKRTRLETIELGSLPYGQWTLLRKYQLTKLASI